MGAAVLGRNGEKASLIRSGQNGVGEQDIWLLVENVPG